MAAAHEKTTMGETDASEASTLNTNREFLDAHSINGEKEAPLKETSDSDEAETMEQAGTAEEYPHGIRLVLLAGASIMGVFLISLDQVSSLAGTREILPVQALRQGRPSSVRRYQRSQTSSAALMTSLGTPRRTF